jgi:2-polyprenyl-6-methoxyphenol hydroxylase-like FAD-dependent oxidoreductase
VSAKKSAPPLTRSASSASLAAATLDWRHYFDDLGKPITDLLDQAGQACGVPIMEVDQQYAVLGRMVLVGDAAHAMSPSMAQGVGLALEDALVLTETLSSLPVHEALAAYEHWAPRIAWVRSQSHRRDSTRGLSPAVRDRVLKLTGRRLAVVGHRALLAMRDRSKTSSSCGIEGA